MPKIFSLLSAFLLVAHAACAFGIPPVSNVSQLEERLEKLRQEVQVPAFSAAIARDDRIVWAKGFGMANRESNIPATPETCYHLASLTKTFAATIILQLVEAGKIDLEAPVSRYGVQIENADAIQVKHLLSHTSEMPIGGNFKYNGARYALLDTVIESASGKSFAELVCRQIIEPLKLTRTAPNVQDERSFRFSGLDREQFAGNLAQGYELQPDKQFKAIDYPAHFSSAAGLISSALDVARFSIALDQNQLLLAPSLERAFTKTVSTSGRSLPYGLGWFVYQHQGVKLVWHYGLWTGNSSLIIKVPDRKLTFVLLANSDRLSRPYLLGIGELMTSPFARTFIEGFVTGDGALPERMASD